MRCKFTNNTISIPQNPIKPRSPPPLLETHISPSQRGNQEKYAVQDLVPLAPHAANSLVLLQKNPKTDALSAVPGSRRLKLHGALKNNSWSKWHGWRHAFCCCVTYRVFVEARLSRVSSYVAWLVGNTLLRTWFWANRRWRVRYTRMIGFAVRHEADDAYCLRNFRKCELEPIRECDCASECSPFFEWSEIIWYIA